MPSGPREFAPPSVGDILAEQSDPAYQAKLAQQRHALMQNHAWDTAFYEATGLWRLKKVLDGTATEQAA